MRRNALLLFAVVLVLIFDAGSAVAAGLLETGDNWLKWTDETKTEYVSGYLWGFGRGFRDGCEAGERTYSTGKLRGLPGEECIPKRTAYSRNLEDYVGGITAYYRAYPTDTCVPVSYVLEGLSDARKLTLQQMHQYFPSSVRGCPRDQEQ
ncbi:MAG: hypothetical protein LAO23_03435 [Acidobacteriia bacterium]|nr:hypothetical protein [Terriglobia bacterium]